MSNDDDCDVAIELSVAFDGLLDSFLIDLVQGRSSFIKKQDLGFLYECSCNSNPLLLST